MLNFWQYCRCDDPVLSLIFEIGVSHLAGLAFWRNYGQNVNRFHNVNIFRCLFILMYLNIFRYIYFILAHFFFHFKLNRSCQMAMTFSLPVYCSLSLLLHLLMTGGGSVENNQPRRQVFSIQHPSFISRRIIHTLITVYMAAMCWFCQSQSLEFFVPAVCIWTCGCIGTSEQFRHTFILNNRPKSVDITSMRFSVSGWAACN